MTEKIKFLVEIKEPITVVTLIFYHLVRYYFPLTPSNTDMTK